MKVVASSSKFNFSTKNKIKIFAKTLTILVLSLFFLQLELGSTFAQSSSFVTTNGTQFILNGKVFRPVGVNMYDAASNPDTHNYDCGPVYSDTDLENSFSFFQQHGISVVRFWAFQTYVKGAGYSDTWDNFRKNGPDWSGIDRVINLAKKYNLKLLPTLENTWVACTEGGAQHSSTSWYVTDYKAPYANYPMSYPDWIKLIVGRYKNEPTIMGWILMNEAEDKEPISSTWTPNGGVSTGMYNFAKDMSALVKSIDTNHLVTLGTLVGNVGGGINGPAYAYIHKLSTIDFIDAHDYSQGTVPLSGSVNNDGKTLPPNCSKNIACILWLSLNDVHKPMLMGEAGIVITAPLSIRANEFDAKIAAFFNAGGAGYLIWHWDPHSSQSYDFSPTDPLVPILQKYTSQNPIPTQPPQSTFSADANNDGKVDGVDYVVWLTHFGQTTTSGPTAGDFNKDGKIDNSDYTFWLSKLN